MAVLKKPIQRIPTPTRSRVIVYEQARPALRSIAALQQSTQVHTQVAMDQTDAAFQVTRQDILKIARMRRSVEDTLVEYYQASATILAKQILKLAHETYQEMHVTVQE